MPVPRILLGSPIHQKPEILEAFLASLKRLTRDSFRLDFLFIDDNMDAESSRLLDEFGSSREAVRLVRVAKDLKDAYVCDRTGHQWKRSLVLKVATFKNHIIETAIEEGYDYVFFIDSDLLVHPFLIDHLLTLKKEIVSEVFWTRWSPEAQELPNVWMSDNYNLAPRHFLEELTERQAQERARQFLALLRRPGVYEVGGLGACTLIARSALLKGVNFSPIYNLSFWGEDRFFCVRAAVLGVGLYVDTQYPAFHVYRDSDLPRTCIYMRSTAARKGARAGCRTNAGAS